MKEQKRVVEKDAPLKKDDLIVITAGQTTGSAILTVAFQTNTLQLSVINSVLSTAPVAMNVSIGGGLLHLSWPSDHLGWQLETNSVGLTSANAWFPYPGSDAVTNLSIPLGAGGNVLFRLKYP